MEHDRLIFIGGSVRSGAALLQKLICTAGETHPLTGECWFLTDQLRTHSAQLSEFEDRHVDFFGTTTEFNRIFRAGLLQYFDDIRKRLSNPQFLVLKHAEISRFFPLLGTWFDNAFFIVCVRDPRDTIASMVDDRERQIKDGVTSFQTSVGRDMYKLSNIFKRFYVQALDYSSPARERTLFVRYEQLVTAVTRECSRIGEFCGLTFREDAQLKSSSTASFWSELYLEDMSAARVGRYAEVLTPSEISQIEEECDDFNRIFNYW